MAELFLRIACRSLLLLHCPTDQHTGKQPDILYMNNRPFESDKQRLLNMGTWTTALVQTDLFSHAAILATNKAIPVKKGAVHFVT